MKKILALCLSIVLVIIVFPACSQFSGDLANSISDDDDDDFSGIDTDGDGFSDEMEINDFNFSAEINPYKFNPYVADVPKISVDLVSLPAVIINYERSEGSTVSVSTDWSEENAKATHTSNTSTKSRTLTHSVGATLSAEYTFGIKAGVTLGFEARYDFTHSSETSNSFTKEQTIEKRNTYGQSRAMEESNSYTFTDASVSMSVNIVNDGHIAFTLKNITLSLVEIDPVNPGLVIPICNLNFDTSYASFPETSLAPGQKFENWVFTHSLDLDTAHHILRDTQNLIIKVASYELTDEKGRSFTHNTTGINAKTANIVIDYGASNECQPEKYQVAVNIDESDDIAGLSTKTIFNDILKIPYTTSVSTINQTEVTGLTGIRDQTADTANGAWIIIHGYTQAGVEKTNIYSPLESYDFDAINVVQGDTLYILYVEDKDHDGLTAREELTYGTDDTDPDTDGDGVSDYDEIKTHNTNPLLTPQDSENTEPDENAKQYISDVNGFGLRSNNDTDCIILTWNAPVTDQLYRRVMIVKYEDTGYESDLITGIPQIGQKYKVGDFISDPENPDRQFEIVYCDNGSSFTDDFSVNGSNAGLTQGKTYYYKIYATDMQDGIGNYFSVGIERHIIIEDDAAHVTVTMNDILITDPNDGSDTCELFWDMNIVTQRGTTEFAYQSKNKPITGLIRNEKITDFSPGEAQVSVPLNSSGWFELHFYIVEDDPVDDDITLNQTFRFYYKNDNGPQCFEDKNYKMKVENMETFVIDNTDFVASYFTNLKITFTIAVEYDTGN